MAGNTRAVAHPSLLDISKDLAVYCNIGSLTKRLQEVREYLSMYKFPILALSETLITEKSKLSLAIHNYHLITYLAASRGLGAR